MTRLIFGRGVLVHTHRQIHAHQLRPHRPQETRSCGCSRVLSIVTLVLHVLSVVGLFYTQDGQRDSCYPTTTSYVSWTATTPADNAGTVLNTTDGWFRRDAGVRDTTTLSLHWLLVSAHLLSAVFQLFAVVWCCPGMGYPYEQFVAQGKNPLRFAEYFYSAGLMLVSLALLAGLRDQDKLLLIAALSGVAQLCGLVVELLLSEPRLSTSLRTSATVAHVGAWVGILAGNGTIWRHLYLSTTVPPFVYVVALLLLLSSFGAVQLAQMVRYAWCRWPDNDVFNQRIEQAYVVQSLVTKALLGWILYFQVLSLARECAH
jgi:hypothetical protein